MKRVEPPMAPLARSVVREILHVSATPWLARALVGMLFVAVLGVPLAAHSPGSTDAGPVLPSPLEPSVPLLDATVDAGMPTIASIVLGRLPKPGPNQKRSGQCIAERAQVEINGGCWIKTETPLPCPDGYQWEHEGRCWLPVPITVRSPTSGDVYPVNLANP